VERGEAYQVGEIGVFPVDIHGGLFVWLWRSLRRSGLWGSLGLELGSRDCGLATTAFMRVPLDLDYDRDYRRVLEQYN
jgi:hypothetical protein